MCIAAPCAACAASPTASDIVGCAWIVRISSSTVHSSRSASVGFGDELGRARADHVHAEHLVVLLVGDDLDEAFGLAGDPGAAEHAELERADADVVAALARLPLGQADAADFRIAVGAAGDLVVVDRPRLAVRRSARRARCLRPTRGARVAGGRAVSKVMTSPIAEMPGTRSELRVDLDVAALEAQPASSAPSPWSPAAAGRDEQIFGARSSRDLAVGAVCASISTPLGPALALVTFVPVSTLMPCRLNDFSSSADTASSSTGTRRGSSSMIVTSLPKRRKIDANSTPTAPLPMMTIDFGTPSARSLRRS